MTETFWQVDVGVLFPDLYKAAKADDPVLLEERAVPARDLFENSQRIYVASPSMGLYTMTFLKRPHHIVLGFGSGRFNIHNTQTTKQTHSLQVSPDRMPVTCIRDFLSSDGHRIVAGTADGFLKSFIFDDGETLREGGGIQLDHAIYSMDTSENYHVCCLDNRQIQVFDAVRAEYVRNVGTVSEEEFVEAEEVGHKQRATCVKFSPGNKYHCISGGWDRTVFLWDIRVEKAAVRSFIGPKICGDGIDLMGDKCLTASFVPHNALQIWDLGSGRLIETIKYRTNENQAENLYSCRFIDSERVIAGGSGSHDAKVINRKTGEVEGVFLDTKPIHSVGYSDGVAAAGGVNCYVHLANLKKK